MTLSRHPIIPLAVAVYFAIIAAGAILNHAWS
jgi:hypothetical protein